MLLCSNSDESEGKSVATREDLSGPFDKCNMAVPTEFGDLGPRPTFLETLRSKSDSGPVKLTGISRNGPLAPVARKRDNAIHQINRYPAGKC